MSYATQIRWQDFSYPVSDLEIEIFKYVESVRFCFHVSIYSMQIPIQLSIGSAFPANRCLPRRFKNVFIYVPPLFLTPLPGSI